MMRLARFILMGLVLVLVAMVSALVAMRFAIHGSEVSVPKFTGLPPQQAEMLAASNGLVMGVEDKFFSSEIPEGRIVSQSPLAGTKVRRGWRVRLALSLGPQRSEIPNLVGQSSRAAEIDLHRRGLDLASMSSADLPAEIPGQVISQNPPANAGAASPKISLLLSAPSEDHAFVMPSFLGKHFADATELVQSAGFAVNKVSTLQELQPSLDVSGLPAGVIVKQVPAPGQKILSGQEISFQITR